MATWRHWISFLVLIHLTCSLYLLLKKSSNTQREMILEVPVTYLAATFQHILSEPGIYAS